MSATETATVELTRLDSKGSQAHHSVHRLPKDRPSISTPTTQAQFVPPAREGASSPTRTTVVEEAQVPPTDGTSKEFKRQELISFASLSWCLFLAGWNDGTLGPIIPRIREVYNVGFFIVSLIFVVACIGFCTGALFNAWFTGKIAFGKIIVLGCSLQTIAYAIMAAAPPFPVFVVAFFINGFGLAVQDAQANGFVAALRDHTKMGILHAVYGLGAFCVPLVATQFAQMDRWSFHFLCSLGIALSTVVVNILVFKFKTEDECLAMIGVDPGEKSENEKSNIRQLMGLKAVHLLAAFICIYVGIEVTIGGWTVTYIIEERGGGPSAGYISSGFFGGMTLGRVALLWVNKKVGERRVVYLYAALAIGFEIMVWFVPSLIGGGVAVSIVGFVLGPLYPIAINHAGKILPRWLLTASIGWIAGIGQAGSALLPFITGAFASRFGIASLQPFLVAMMAVMAVLWLLVPNRAVKRS